MPGHRGRTTVPTDTETLEAFLAAFNSHDAEAVMQFFADDCVMGSREGRIRGGGA